jgi:hypothetical protein
MAKAWEDSVVAAVAEVLVDLSEEDAVVLVEVAEEA